MIGGTYRERRNGRQAADPAPFRALRHRPAAGSVAASPGEQRFDQLLADHGTGRRLAPIPVGICCGRSVALARPVSLPVICRRRRVECTPPPVREVGFGAAVETSRSLHGAGRRGLVLAVVAMPGCEPGPVHTASLRPITPPRSPAFPSARGAGSSTSTTPITAPRRAALPPACCGCSSAAKAPAPPTAPSVMTASSPSSIYAATIITRDKTTESRVAIKDGNVTTIEDRPAPGR